MAGNEFSDGVIRTIISTNKKIEIDKGSDATAKQSMQWFVENASTLAEAGNSKVKTYKSFPKGLDSSFITNGMDVLAVGRMLMYAYDPKTKEKLPYYDTFPLIFLVDFTSDGWYGLNLHYLPPLYRTAIIDNLEPYYRDDSLSDSSKAKMSHEILKKTVGVTAIEHCFKRYLVSHVRSSFMFIDQKDWRKAVMLPTERFKKSSKTNVHRVFTAKV